MLEPYYYINGPKNFFPEGFDLNIFKKNDRGIFEVSKELISLEVLKWFEELGVTDIKGLIFRKHLIPRTNLHIDPKFGGPEWVKLYPKFKEKILDYKPYVNQFAFNWVYQKAGITEWYKQIEDPDDVGVSSMNTGWFAWSSYDGVQGPISTCYHTDNPIFYNTSIPHVPVNSVDKITVSIRPVLNNNPDLTFEEVYNILCKSGIIKEHQ